MVEAGCRGTPREVVGRADRVDVARQVEVEVLHRDDLAVAAAGRAALDPEDRAERRLADAHRGLAPDRVEALAEADGRRRLALAERRRRDRRHDDVLAARVLRLEPADRLERDLRLRRPVQLDLVVAEPRSVATSTIGRGVTDRAISRSDGKAVAVIRAPRGSRAGGWRASGPRGACAWASAARDEVGEQQRVGQRAHATRHGRDRRGDLARRLEVDVADELAVDDVDPDVDDDRAAA